jgi:predicted ATP-grasp superfamily ATP-dependent carboligase
MLRSPGVQTIMVTDAGIGSAIAIIRSLGRKGWRVIAADYDPHSPGFHSRYAQDQLLYPPPETSPRECIETLLHAAREKRVDLIIPATDAIILPLSDGRAQFDGVCKLALPDAAALDVVTNKLKTLQLAERLGVPAPLTCPVYTMGDALEHGRRLGWPVVLKPQVSRLYREQKEIQSFKVSYANNLHQLVEQMRRFDSRCPVLLQEYYQGTGYGVELLMYEGRALAAFQHKRLREVPINGGASAFRQSMPLDPTLYSHAVRLLKELNWTGLAMVEFKVGKDGPKLMEINGRVWGSLPLAVHSGMDFPARLAELYLYGPPGREAAADTSYVVGTRTRNLYLEMVWIAQVLFGRRRYPFLPMPGRCHALKAVVQLLNPAYKFDILSLEDPYPGVEDVFKSIGRFVDKIKQEKTCETRLAPGHR